MDLSIFLFAKYMPRKIKNNLYILCICKKVTLCLPVRMESNGRMKSIFLLILTISLYDLVICDEDSHFCYQPTNETYVEEVPLTAQDIGNEAADIFKSLNISLGTHIKVSDSSLRMCVINNLVKQFVAKS